MDIVESPNAQVEFQEGKERSGMNCKSRTPCSICEDLNRPLDNVFRAWIRRPVTILLLPLLLVGAVVFATRDWIHDCW